MHIIVLKYKDTEVQAMVGEKEIYFVLERLGVTGGKIVIRMVCRYRQKHA